VTASSIFLLLRKKPVVHFSDLYQQAAGLYLSVRALIQVQSAILLVRAFHELGSLARSIFTLKIEAAWIPEMLVTYHKAACRHK
jgi:hypothetical protein